MTLTLSTQWQYNSYPSAMESNLRIDRALSFQQELRFGTVGRSLQTLITIPGLSKANTPMGPTDNSLRANVRRAHYQAAIWRSCEAQDPPQESAEDFGW